MPLKGLRELNNRLEAITHSFEPIGDDWAERTANEYRGRVRRNSGRLASSFRKGETGDREATVTGHYTAKFEDAGARPHPIVARRGNRLHFQKRGRDVVVSAVNHPGMRGTNFIDEGAVDALDQVPMADHMIEKWNGAA